MLDRYLRHRPVLDRLVLALALIAWTGPAAGQGSAALDLAVDTPTLRGAGEQRPLVPIEPPQPELPRRASALSLTRPSDELRLHGVEWFLLSRTAAGVRLALLDPRGDEIGAYAVRHEEDGGRTFSTEWLDSRFSDPSQIGAQVWSELRMSPALALATSAGMESITAASIPCDYSWIVTSDIFAGLGLLRSVACERATLDVNGKCSNSTCWGCCELLPCDCVCMAGDLNCSCWRSGYRCAQSNCDWQIIPDPETCEDDGGSSGGGSGGGGGGGWGDGGGGETCVDVYCNDVYAGQACGTTTAQIVDEAWNMC